MVFIYHYQLKLIYLSITERNSNPTFNNISLDIYNAEYKYFSSIINPSRIRIFETII